MFDRLMGMSMERRAREILHELEETKCRLLSELTDVDKETLSKLREIVEDYYAAENRVAEILHEYNLKATSEMATFVAEIERIRDSFEKEIVAYCNSYDLKQIIHHEAIASMLGAKDTVVKSISEHADDVLDVVQSTGGSVTKVMSQLAVTKSIGPRIEGGTFPANSVLVTRDEVEIGDKITVTFIGRGGAIAIKDFEGANVDYWQPSSGNEVTRSCVVDSNFASLTVIWGSIEIVELSTGLSNRNIKKTSDNALITANETITFCPIDGLYIGYFSDITHKWSDSKNFVSIKENIYFNVKAGDSIRLTDYTDAVMNMVMFYPDGSYEALYLSLGEKVFERDCKIAFHIRNRTEREQTSTMELGNLLEIKSKTALIDYTGKCMSSRNTEFNLNDVFIMPPTFDYISYDTKVDAITIPRGTYLYSETFGTYELAEDAVIDVSTQNSSLVFVVFNWKAKVFVCIGWDYLRYFSSPERTILFSARLKRYRYTPKLNLSIPHYIDNKLLGVVKKTNINPNVKTISHRGYNTLAPENTISAIKMAREFGYNEVEIDIQFTSDHVPVLCHDSLIDRTSDGSGEISNMTLEEIKGYDFGSWFSDKYVGEKIPTFEECLRVCKRLGLSILIDIKNATEEETAILVDLVKRSAMIEHVSWQSYETAHMLRVRNLINDATICLNADTYYDGIISDLISLKNGVNKVFVNLPAPAITDGVVNNLVYNDIKLRIQPCDNDNTLKSLPDYVSEIITGKVNVEELYYDNPI